MTAASVAFLAVIALVAGLAGTAVRKWAQDLRSGRLTTSSVGPEKAFTTCKPRRSASTQGPPLAPDQVGALADVVISLGVIAAACVVGLHATLRHHLVVAVISDLRRVLAGAFAELS